MVKLMDELREQPAALHRLANYYEQNIHLFDFFVKHDKKNLIFTGMGASFHAGAIASFYLNQAGVRCEAIQAIDLLNYERTKLDDTSLLVYISQSGSSGEVPALLNTLPKTVPVVAITNNPDSALAAKANLILPMMAGDEEFIAGKTYMNSLAILWLLKRTLLKERAKTDFIQLLGLANQVSNHFKEPESIFSQWSTYTETCPILYFLGSGPHGITARECAMTMSEWAKVTIYHSGIGAFRHGFIEAVEPGFAVVIFRDNEPGNDSALTLGNELKGYGVKVIMNENGVLRDINEQPNRMKPSLGFLSHILNIIPIQIVSEALANQKGYHGFRYINKIVTTI